MRTQVRALRHTDWSEQVRLGSNNTALVVVNSYWLWITDCEFSFLAGQGQRPAIILRGQSPSSSDGLTDQVYLVRMERINFAGGGVQCVLA
jgi:hypothetical protein